MPDFSTLNLGALLALIFGVVALFLVIISLTTFAVFFKNAEKRSVATGIAIAYIIIFIIICIIALTSFAIL